MLDVGTAGEDAFKVNPLPLHINPDIEEDVDTIQLLFPGRGVLLKYCMSAQLGDDVKTPTSVVRREFHGLQRVEVLSTFVEQLIPTTDRKQSILHY